MTTVPLGTSAYRRQSYGMPEIRLENRWLETMPQNLREHVSLVARPGTSEVAEFSSDLGADTLSPLRGTFSKTGLLNGDLFVVSGHRLWRYSSTAVKTQISGAVNGTGRPATAWQKGIGYERLFIADGLLLNFYAGGVAATGTLTLSGGAITNQVIEIGGVYYSWSATVDAGSPDGTSAKPWLALLGGTDADSLTNMAKLLDFNGVRGVDFSTALAGPSTIVTAPTTPLTTTLPITAISTYADGNAITTSVFSGAHLAWGGATLSDGGVHALQGVPVPDGQPVVALASVSGYVLVAVANSQKFYWVEPGETTIDPLNFAEKESNPDAIVDMLTVGDQVLIMGNGSTESWYATGNPTAPFQPNEGRAYQRGVVEGTAAVVKDSVILVGDDGIAYEVGTGTGGAEAVWGVHRVSDHGIEERIRRQLRREQGLTP